MFYYISFLRPPPLQVSPSSPVIITPQIANDLRTESFESPQNIFYSWIPATLSSNSTTNPIKLTTWKPENAYKEITVPLPPGIRDGQSWRLLLSSEPQQIHIDMKEEQLGAIPFPVLSTPINFTKSSSSKRGGKQKQEKIERHYHLPGPPATLDPSIVLKITEQTSFDLDKKIWDSGIGLGSWLVSLASDDTNSSKPLVDKLKQVLFSSDSRSIIELGAGTGIVALTLGALRSRFVASATEADGQDSETARVDDGCIITTDLPSAMPLLEGNVSANSTLFARPSVRPQPQVLDWDEENLPRYTEDLKGRLDAIIMADVTYNTSSFPALVRTLSNLVNLNPPIACPPPVILLGYKQRDDAERTLWTMAQDVGIYFERVGERRGAGGAPVEVWIGQVKYEASSN